MKNVKKLLSLFAASLLSLCVLFAVGCGGGNATAYKFTVQYEDGTKATNLKVQLCKGTEMCLPGVDVVNGTCEIAPEQGADVYDIHVWSSNMQTEYTVLSEDTTPASYGEITVVIAAE